MHLQRLIEYSRTFSHGSAQLNTDRDTKELIEKLVLSRVYPHVFTNGETGFFKHAKCFFLINRRGFLSAPDKKGKWDNLGIIFQITCTPLKRMLLPASEPDLVETILMRGHNVCFRLEIRKIVFKLSSIPSLI